MSATMRLKCVHCGVEFDYERPALASQPGVLAELAECPNGHMAIVSESRALTEARERAKKLRGAS